MMTMGQGSSSCKGSPSPPETKSNTWWEQQLRKVQENDPTLETVFSRSVLNDNELMRFALAMKNNTHVRYLFVNPPKGIPTAKALATAMKESRLSSIHLLCFQEKGRSRARVMQILYDEGIQPCTTLQELRITGHIGRVKACNNVLPHLRILSLQQVESNQLQKLRTGLLQSSSLRELRLIGYELTDKDFTMLASTSIKALTLHTCTYNEDFLENWLGQSQLVALTLTECNISADRAHRLLQATAGHRTLESLSLAGNPAIGYPGLQSIAALLATNTLTLKNLELSYCSKMSESSQDLRQEVSQVFLQSMQVNTHLHSLDLTRNGLELHGSSQRFHQAIQRSTAPQALGALLRSANGVPPGLWCHAMSIYKFNPTCLYDVLQRQADLVAFSYTI